MSELSVIECPVLRISLTVHLRHHLPSGVSSLTINVFCLYGAGRNEFDAGNIHFKGHWKRWAPKNRGFFGPFNCNERSKCHFSPKMWRFLGPTPTIGPCNGFTSIKGGNCTKCISYHFSPLMGPNPFTMAIGSGEP
jgi:hypothetical protein